MPPKVSPIWEYFHEDANDPSVVVCQVVGCKKPKVSRGNTGTARSNMTNPSMTSHLAKFSEFKASRNKASDEKRKHKVEDDDDDLNTVVLILT